MDYSRPSFLFNKHLETIYPAAFRTVQLADCKQIRITTPDNDFLDLDWYNSKSEKLVILSHGLEGNSKRAYVLGMANAFIGNGCDVLAWNYRGCSSEMNSTLRFYHSGATDDLDTIVQFALNHKAYNEINLIGFSLGGNITLKFLGEEYQTSKIISKAVAISVPLDLSTSCAKISSPPNWIYEQRFLRSLKEKVQKKNKNIPIPNVNLVFGINNLKAFDDIITGPLHGFTDAEDYYRQCSSIYFLHKIKSPSLIINALNDPFLSKECFPEKSINKNISFDYQKHGGHVGFSLFNEKKLYWSELRALEFIQEGK